jgi:Ca-activated chloride channel homolog
LCNTKNEDYTRWYGIAMPDFFFSLDTTATSIAIIFGAVVLFWNKFRPKPLRDGEKINQTIGRAKAPGLNRLKVGLDDNADPLSIVQPRELSRDPIIWFISSQSLTPSISFPSLSTLHTDERGWQEHFSFLPQRLVQIAFALLLLAFTDPHLMVHRQEPPPTIQTTPTEGIGIYLILDQSGSMQEKIWASNLEGEQQLMTKIQLLKTVTEAFVEKNSSNLIGLITFARVPQVLSPLTLDHQVILHHLSKFDIISDRTFDGTSMGYAIYKAASLITATRFFAEELKKKNQLGYQIKNTIMILVTDGFQEPNPIDEGNRLRTMGLEDAAAYAKANGIRLYMINISPEIKEEVFAPHRRLFTRITDMTGGKFFIVDTHFRLSDIYKEIDKLEKSAIPQPKSNTLEDLSKFYKRVSFYPFLVGLGMFCLLLAIGLETTLLRKAP